MSRFWRWVKSLFQCEKCRHFRQHRRHSDGILAVLDELAPRDSGTPKGGKP